MDLGQIYTQIQKLLLNNEEIILPNVGIFRVESTPASFMQDGKTILPPSKKLLFENKIIHGARLPWQEDLGAKIVEALAQEESFEIPGFGIFTKTQQGGITFTANESFDFAPDNFSLEAIQLEVNEMPDMQPEKIPHAPEKDPKNKSAKTTAPPQRSQTDEWQTPKWVIYTAIVIGVIILLVAFVLIFKEQLKPVLENLLYTQEELEIIQKWAGQN